MEISSIRIHGHITAFAQMDYYVAAHPGSHIAQALLSDGAGHPLYCTCTVTYKATKSSHGLMSKAKPCGMYTVDFVMTGYYYHREADGAVLEHPIHIQMHINIKAVRLG